MKATRTQRYNLRIVDGSPMAVMDPEGLFVLYESYAILLQSRNQLDDNAAKLRVLNKKLTTPKDMEMPPLASR